MNWHHWYWWTWPAGIVIGITVVCAVNYIRNEIGMRQWKAQLEARRDEIIRAHTGRSAPGGSGGKGWIDPPPPAGSGGTCGLNFDNLDQVIQRLAAGVPVRAATWTDDDAEEPTQ